MRYWESLGLPGYAGAGALGDVGTPEMLALGAWAMLGLRGTTPKRWRWRPVIIRNELRLPSFASAGTLRDAGTPWDYSKALVLGPCVTLGLDVTRWDSCDVHSCHVFLHSRAHLGLAGVETFIILNNTHQSQMPHPRNSWATMIHFPRCPQNLNRLFGDMLHFIPPYTYVSLFIQHYVAS